MNDEALIQAILDDWRTAPLDDKLRTTLAFLETLTLRPDDISPDEIRAMRRAGVSDEGIEEAIAVCAVFNLADRVADSFGYVPPNPEQAAAFGKMRLARGYSM
jgi:alkylhydroperoxidase family enzyme